MKLKTTEIQGQQYVMVNERVRAFHKLFPNGRIEVVVIEHPVLTKEGRITLMAKAIPDVATPERFFTGYSQEVEGSSNVNKTSFVENCETSAVGRALGFLGIGIDTSIATAEEVAQAVKTQQRQPRFTEKEGLKYPHVTDIISGCEVPNIPYIDEHAYIGQMYHEANSNWIKTGKFELNKDTVYTQPKNVHSSWETFSFPKLIERTADKFVFEFDSSEIKVFNKEYLYCGTFDILGKVNSKRSLMDMKKFKAADKKLVDEYFMQLEAYARAMEEYPEQLVLITLNPETPVEKAIIIKDKKEERAKYWQMFHAKRVEFKNKFGV